MLKDPTISYDTINLRNVESNIRISPEIISGEDVKKGITVNVTTDNKNNVETTI